MSFRQTKNIAFQVFCSILFALIATHSLDAYAGKRSSSKYKILTRHVDKCLDLKGRKTHSGNTVHQWACKMDIVPPKSRLWIVERMGKGYVRFRSAKKTNMCLQVRKGKLKNNRPVQIGKCGKTSRQQWRLKYRQYHNKRKFYSLRSKANLKYCLEIRKADRKNGGRAQIYKCVKSTRQYFTFWIPNSHKMSSFIEDIGKEIEKSVKQLSKDLQRAAVKASKDIKKQAKYSFRSAKELGRKAIKKSIRGMKKSLKGMKSLAKKIGNALYIKIATPIKNKFASTGKNLKNVYKTLFTGKNQGGTLLINGIKTGNASKIVKGLKKIGVAPLEAFVKDFKSSGGGSILIQVDGSVGTIVADIGGSVGIAIGVGNLIRLIRAMKKKKKFTGPIGSLYAAGGLAVGATGGASAGVTVGWHVADPDGVGGPGADVTFAGVAKAGGSVSVILDLSTAPPKFVNVMFGFQAGAKLEVTVGVSFTQIIGKVCGNGKVKKFDQKCPTR